jgi:hypothetical protein
VLQHSKLKIFVLQTFSPTSFLSRKLFKNSWKVLFQNHPTSSLCPDTLLTSVEAESGNIISPELEICRTERSVAGSQAWRRERSSTLKYVDTYTHRLHAYFRIWYTNIFINYTFSFKFSDESLSWPDKNLTLFAGGLSCRPLQWVTIGSHSGRLKYI